MLGPGPRSARARLLRDFDHTTGSIDVVGSTATEFDAQPVVSNSPVDPLARPSWFARSWALLAVLATTAVLSIVVRHVIYPALSWNRDEATYLWQVSGLRAGQLMTTTGGLPQFFQPWLTGVRDGHFFSQYTLGWPGLMLVADVIFGSPAAAIVWGTMLAVFGTYVFTRELTRDHRLAIVTSVLMLASPMLITQSGVYLGYLFSLGLGLLFGAALLSGVRLDQRWRFVAAGVALGVLFITRPFDAVLWALAMGGYAVFVTWRQWPRQFRAAALVFAGFVPLLMITLAQNRIVTGSFGQFPFTAKEPLDKFGFGYRRLMPHIVGIKYTFVEAVKGTGLSALAFPQFLIGSYLGLVVALAGLWLRRRDRTTWLLLALIVVFPAGYFVFWGNRLASGFADLSGPVYFVPLFVPVCIFIATALLRLWARRRGLLILLCCLLVAGAAPFLYDSAATNRRISLAQEPWRAATASLHRKSLIIVRDSGPYLLHINPFSQNTPDLDGRLLFAVDRGAGSFTLLDRYPDRAPYVERTSNPLLDDAIHHTDASPPTVSLIPLVVHEGGVVTVRVRVRNPSNAPVVMAMLQVGHRLDQRVLTADPTRPGVYETEWKLAPAGSPATSTGAVPVTGAGSFTVIAAAGASATEALNVSNGHEVLERFTSRVHDGRLQVLTPSRRTVVQPVDGRIVLRDVAHLPTLRVDLGLS
jgi:hypothetical protein